MAAVLLRDESFGRTLRDSSHFMHKAYECYLSCLMVLDAP